MPETVIPPAIQESQATIALSRPGYVAEQFDDVAQQREADTLGMWGFLVTEVMLFGAVFTAYTVARIAMPEAFTVGSHHLGFWLGTINTAILLTSSLFVALAVHAAEADRRKAITGFLAAAIVLGALFLGLKFYEYWEHYHEGLAPGAAFTYAGEEARGVELFFFLYFAMTGLHAVHMLIGLGILTTMAVLAWRGWFSGGRHLTVEVAGLYWHFVDIVWVFLYPLLYLVGHHMGG